MRQSKPSYYLSVLLFISFCVVLMPGAGVLAEEAEAAESTPEVTAEVLATEPPAETPTATPLPPTETPIPTTEPPTATATDEPVEEIPTESVDTATPEATEEASEATADATDEADDALLENQAYQGRLYWSQTIYNRCMGSTSHEYNYWFDGTYQYFIDIQPVSGSLRYDMRLTGTASANVPSAIDGRGILAMTSGPGWYDLQLLPRAGSNGCYNIAIWQGIPNLFYIYPNQSSYSNINRWQFWLESNQTYYIEVVRTEGNVEFSYDIRRRDNNQVVSGSAGSSVNGRAVSAAVSGPGWFDFRMNFGSTAGSYRVSIVQGIRGIDPPSITAPSSNQVVGTNFNVNLQRSAGNGRGTIRYQVQIGTTCTFASLAFDQISSQPTFNVTLPAGSYCVRAR